MLSLTSARTFSAADARRNVIAGLVVGIIALPLSIALAVAVGVPPAMGLYTSIFAGAAAATFGGSNYNITGPTAALVPILGHVVQAHGAGALPMVGLMAGLVLVAMGALRVGRLMRYMPGLVVVGFTAGIALSIGFGQINNFFGISGIDPSREHFHARAWDTFRHLETAGVATPVLGIASLALLIVWAHLPRLNRIPGTLVAVVTVTALTWGTGIETPTLGSRYGAIPGGLPTPSLAFFDLGIIADLWPAAVTIAILGAMESLLSAVVADGMVIDGERHEPDRELVGQGIANLVAPVMGGIPATAAIARTAAGIRNGATSKMTGVVHSLTVLALTLAVGGLASHIPLTVLAAVLIVVAWNIAEAPEVARLLRKAPREDAAVLAMTIMVTLFFDLTYAIGLGVLISAVLLLRRMVRLPSAQELLPDETGRIRLVSAELSDLMQGRPDIAFFTVQGMLSFHSVAAFEYELHANDGDPLILRMKDVHHIDTTGLLTLEGIIEHRRRNGKRTIITAIQPDFLPVLHRFGILDKVGRENVFAHTRDAISSVPSPQNSNGH